MRVGLATPRVPLLRLRLRPRELRREPRRVTTASSQEGKRQKVARCQFSALHLVRIALAWSCAHTHPVPEICSLNTRDCGPRAL